MTRADTQIVINVPPEIKTALTLEAKRELISLSALTRRYLAEVLKPNVTKKTK